MIQSMPAIPRNSRWKRTAETTIHTLRQEVFTSSMWTSPRLEQRPRASSYTHSCVRNSRTPYLRTDTNAGRRWRSFMRNICIVSQPFTCGSWSPKQRYARWGGFLCPSISAYHIVPIPYSYLARVTRIVCIHGSMTVSRLPSALDRRRDQHTSRLAPPPRFGHIFALQSIYRIWMIFQPSFSKDCACRLNFRCILD